MLMGQPTEGRKGRPASDTHVPDGAARSCTWGRCEQRSSRESKVGSTPESPAASAAERVADVAVTYQPPSPSGQGCPTATVGPSRSTLTTRHFGRLVLPATSVPGRPGSLAPPSLAEGRAVPPRG